MASTGREHLNGMIRGAIGSLAGSAAMRLYFKASQKLARGQGRGRAAKANGRRRARIIERIHALDDISVVGRTARKGEISTEAVGRIAYDVVIGHDPDASTRQKLGEAVSWSYGALLGGVYGALRPRAALPDLKGGLGYGTAAWLVGDEVMVPLLGLSSGPTAHPWREHATMLGAHLVYGAVMAATAQALKRVM